MKIRILCVGKIKESYLNEAIQDYVKRLRKYCNVEIIEVKDVNSKIYDEKQVIQMEKDLLEKYLNYQDLNIALEIEGQTFNSMQFSSYVMKCFEVSSTITFIIGGSYGISPDISNKCRKLSFSTFTFTHQMIRWFLLEQLYRSFKIHNNESYHK